MAKLYRIEDYRKRWAASREPACTSRRPVRAVYAVLAKELAELRRTTPKPLVLSLQNLEAGVPFTDAGWDFIFSTELLSTLPSVAACQVVKTAVARLKPGGRLLLTNRAAGPNQRDEEAMARLAASVPSTEIGGLAVFRDASGLNVFLELHRSCAGRRGEDAESYAQRG